MDEKKMPAPKRLRKPNILARLLALAVYTTVI